MKLTRSPSQAFFGETQELDGLNAQDGRGLPLLGLSYPGDVLAWNSRIEAASIAVGQNWHSSPHASLRRRGESRCAEHGLIAADNCPRPAACHRCTPDATARQL